MAALWTEFGIQLIIEVVQHSVGKAAFPVFGSDVAVLVCVLVHSKGIQVVAVNIQRVAHTCHIAVGGHGVGQNHNHFLAGVGGLFEPADHIGNHIVLYGSIGHDPDLVIGVGMLLHIFPFDGSYPVNNLFISEGDPLRGLVYELLV